jgi:hypothetical protein
MSKVYAYVWRSLSAQQIALIILASIAAVLATAPLESQRHIINPHSPDKAAILSAATSI